MGNSPDAAVENGGPGAWLRAERERQGRPLDDVAESLHLDVKIVRALEADDFGSLPAPIFVKGYLNGYCRLLGLSAREVLNEYERAAGQVKPPPLQVSRGTGEQVTSSHARVAFVSWIVVLLAVAMVVLWWMSRQVPETVDTAEPEPAEAELAAPADATREQPPAGETTAQSPRTLADMFAEIEAPAVEETRADDTPPPPGWLVVEIRYTEDCWTEVTDATGRRLHFDLVRGGGTLTLEGAGPFTVFLGNAPAADIVANGEAFDHTPYIRTDDVARFTIEPDEEN